MMIMQFRIVAVQSLTIAIEFTLKNSFMIDISCIVAVQSPNYIISGLKWVCISLIGLTYSATRTNCRNLWSLYISCLNEFKSC